MSKDTKDYQSGTFLRSFKIIGSHWSEKGYSQITLGFVQSKSPTDLSNYKCTEAGINGGINVPSKVCGPQSRRKRCSLLNFAQIKKNLEKKIPLFSNFKGPCFLTFFALMSNEWVWALLSFSYGPHSKQEEVSKMLQFLSIRQSIV